MASHEPSEGEISQVIDFAGLDPQEDRPMAIQALKDTGGNTEAVIMQYFDNPQSFRQKFGKLWDDSMFSSDRDGNKNEAGIAFQIESVGQNDIIQGVTPPPDQYNQMAPSRPPSRSNNRSALGRMVDWVSEDTLGAAASNGASREEEEMERALRESAQEAGVSVPNQQSGVMDSSTAPPYFGPANRTDYEPGDWALVSTASTEKKPTEPGPSSRKRAPGAPAVLVQGSCSAGNHCLGGLLTILHEIPMARNVLLQTGTEATSYGFNSEWWKGREILPPHILARLQSGELQWEEQDETKPDFEEEIHRLMAFLDSTERSYGTASVLADLVPYASLGTEKEFYEFLGPRNEEVLSPLISLAALTPVLSDDEANQEARFGLMEMEHMRNDYTYIKTLYESIDHTMWSDVLSWNELHEGSKMAVFKETGDVLAIKVGGDGPEESIEIPERLYLERYLASRKDEARRIQTSWCETKTAIERIATEQQKLYVWRNDWNQDLYDRKQMIHKAATQWKTYTEYLETLGQFWGMESSGFDTDRYPEYRMAPCELSDEEEEVKYKDAQDVLKLTDRVLSDMDEKMNGLNAQLERIKVKQRFLGRLLTQPDKPGRPRPMECKEHLLRGIATQSDIVYMCQRREADLIDLDDEPKPRDQWWRLAYSPNDEPAVKAECLVAERVLREVWEKTKTPLLIYASQAALDAPKLPLTGPLQRFVRADNKAFRQELNLETSDAGVESSRSVGQADPISPSKRKHRADSVDSIESNRASLGSNGDNPLEDISVAESAHLTATTGSLKGEPSCEPDSETLTNEGARRRSF